MSDAIDQAIAAAEQPQPIDMAQRQLTISTTGRPFVFLHPVDMTESELFEVVGWMATGFRAELEQRRRQHDPAARLWVPPASALGLTKTTWFLRPYYRAKGIDTYRACGNIVA